MKIAVAYHLGSPGEGERLRQEDVDRVCALLVELHHRVTPVEVSGTPATIVARLVESAPALVLNLARGRIGKAGQVSYAALFEQLRLPYTGSGAALLDMNLDRKLAQTVLAAQGVAVAAGGRGRALTVPLLEALPGKVVEAVEGRAAAKLTPEQREAVRALAKKAFEAASCRDVGVVELRLDDHGTPRFVALDPLPSLRAHGPLMTAAAAAGLDEHDVLRLVVRSAARRHDLAVRTPRRVDIAARESTGPDRPTARELGIRIGRFSPGQFNAITDLKGVRVGHVTTIRDDVKVPGEEGTTAVRTGVTAVLPSGGDVFKRRLVAGGFVLNGIGEMAGLTQLMEWGWLETPILLTNSHSVGRVHHGVIEHMTKRHPELGTRTDVVLPVVGETDDSFLNDVRVGTSPSTDAVRAIEAAKGGRVEQGSVGAGTGMTTFDFAGGIGTSSRIVPIGESTFTLGVLVLSNFGRMASLNVAGAVIGRQLDPLYEMERRTKSYGSIIVVVGTDAPLVSSQLGRLSKRAALGLGRAGSIAASTSGEIIVAFSTANRLPRTQERPSKYLSVSFLSDAYVNDLYEAVIEATEESVLNAIFCSRGMSGRQGRFSPPLPSELVVELLGRA